MFSSTAYANPQLSKSVPASTPSTPHLMLADAVWFVGDVVGVSDSRLLAATQDAADFPSGFALNGVPQALELSLRQ
jgi:hypothetical protein